MDRVSRRHLLELILVAGAGAPFSTLLAAELLRTETANMVLGPFYPQVKPLDQDADLTVVRGRKGRAAGQVIDVSGRLLTRHGEPVRNARIDIWQANTHGRYDHTSDPNSAAPLDPNFQGFGVLHTDDQGRYRFKTIKPGPYPAFQGAWMRAPHIHFDIQGRVDRKVTQMFFPGEPLNEQDRLLRGVLRNPETLISTVQHAASGELIVKWDVILASG